MPVTPGSIPASIPGTLLEKALTSSALARAGIGGALGAGAGALMADEDSRGTGALTGGALAALAALGLRPLAQKAVEGNWAGAGNLFSERLLREYADNGAAHAQMMAQRASPRWQHMGIRSVDGNDIYSYLTAGKKNFRSHYKAAAPRR